MPVRKAPWEGGPEELQMLRAAMSESSLILHGPPDLPRDAEILGVCGISAENADQNKYGWMLSICADCISLKTWASSLNIQKFLENIDGVNTDDETVHSIIGTHEDDIKTMPNNNKDFKAMFTQELAKSAQAAVLRGTVLTVMIFAPVTPEQDICLDLDKKRIFVTVDSLYHTVNEATNNVQLPVMILTPSPFTGGWLCRSINPVVCPGSDQMMRIIAKSSGGAFAKRFVRSFTERNSPLMTDSQRARITYDDPMPLRPTALQTDSLHRFQRQIHESLEHRLSAFAQDHAFILRPESAWDPSVFSDTWAEYGPRLGLRFERWAERWGSTRPTINHPERFEFLGEAFGGTRESQLFHLTHLINTELATNQGDWGRKVGGCTGELYAHFLKQPMPTEDQAKRVFDAIEFRASSAIVAQMVVKAFALPVPDGAKCRYWHDKMDGVADEYYRKLQYAFGETHALFDAAAVLPGENQHDFKNVRFFRAARWLSAAIALRFENASREEIEKFVSRDVARFITKIQDAQKTLLLEDKYVTRAGADWFAALGLGGETLAVANIANSGTDVAPAPDDTDLVGQAPIGPQLDGQKTSWTKCTEAENSTVWIDMQNVTEEVLIISTLRLSWTTGSTSNQNGLRNSSADAGGKATGNSSVQSPHIDNNVASRESATSVSTSREAINSTRTSFETAHSVSVSHEAINSSPASFETANSVPKVAINVPSSSLLGVDDNMSAWDEILSQPAASSSDQKKKQARISFQESDDLLDLEEQNVDEPAGLTCTGPAVEHLEDQAVDKPVTPALLKPAAISLEAQVVDKLATPTLSEPAATYLEEKTSRLAEALKEVSREMSAGGTEAEYIAQVFKKAAEIIEEDEVLATIRSKALPTPIEKTLFNSPASLATLRSKDGPTAAEKTSFNSSASFAVDKESSTWSKWLEAASPRSPQTTREGKEIARNASEGAAAASPYLLGASPKITGGHPRMGSLDVPMQSWARPNPMGTSAMEHTSGMEFSREATNNTESARLGTVQAATAVNQLAGHSGGCLEPGLRQRLLGSRGLQILTV
ncbi:hypothetical protein CHGG_06321 [Chaetomium globosum CBS 148.51]|uniref:Uncharacterized protein n=1 Tax=Chaetomium globosum (strain ATCC 6205 / CBS 148.51 / DSM 1962 / NBRC 6347 / NRRL 1970) TaxID=306901 RepID=Q2H4U4_CHAGB|nr:uncharacterized protein CHGG_06321 [Chaetomium globosum CBS 148.51]EAQ89702.1 hypothetical protein CHGG_06321 [Chaetomium globosum CBS 148.51]